MFSRPHHSRGPRSEIRSRDRSSKFLCPSLFLRLLSPLPSPPVLFIHESFFYFYDARASPVCHGDGDIRIRVLDPSSEMIPRERAREKFPGLQVWSKRNHKRTVRSFPPVNTAGTQNCSIRAPVPSNSFDGGQEDTSRLRDVRIEAYRRSRRSSRKSSKSGNNVEIESATRKLCSHSSGQRDDKAAAQRAASLETISNL